MNKDFLTIIFICSVGVNFLIFIDFMAGKEKLIKPDQKIITIDSIHYSPNEEQCIYFHRSRCVEKFLILYIKG